MTPVLSSMSLGEKKNYFCCSHVHGKQDQSWSLKSQVSNLLIPSWWPLRNRERRGWRRDIAALAECPALKAGLGKFNSCARSRSSWMNEGLRMKCHFLRHQHKLKAEPSQHLVRATRRASAVMGTASQRLVGNLQLEPS